MLSDGLSDKHLCVCMVDLAPITAHHLPAAELRKLQCRTGGDQHSFTHVEGNECCCVCPQQHSVFILV